MLVADNYKIMQEGSHIKISFLKPYNGSQKLGDPNVFEYDKPRFEANGEYKLNEQLPQAIADFCRKYKISEITVYYRENGPHKVPVIEFEKEPQGFPYSNYNIIYAQEDNISYPYSGKLKMIKDHIFLIRTPGDIM